MEHTEFLELLAGCRLWPVLVADSGTVYSRSPHFTSPTTDSAVFLQSIPDFATTTMAIAKGKSFSWSFVSFRKKKRENRSLLSLKKYLRAHSTLVVVEDDKYYYIMTL